MTQKDTLTSNSTSHYKETSSLIKCKDEKIIQQQQRIQEQEEVLQQQNQKIYRQARIIRQQQQRIQAIENTLSWKVTEPLRRVDRFLGIRTLPLSKIILRIVKHLFKDTGSLSPFPDMESKEIKVPDITVIDISESENVPVEDTTISVIIPVLNGANYLKLLLPTLKKQKGIKTIEIITVDSGSTDGSIEICKNFNTTSVTITFDEFSHSYARNIGAEHAHGQYLLFLTQDALPPNDTWLYEMFSVLKKNDVVAISCKEYPRSDADLFGRVQMWMHYNWLGITNQDRILSKPVNSDYQTLREHSQLNDVACLIKETVFSKYTFRGEYAEDLDLGLRLIHDGYKIASVSSIGIIHSHTRSCYYYLQRGYIDSFSMSKLFDDFPSPDSNIAFKDFCDDIILTYFNLSNAIDCLKDSHEIDIATFFEKFLYKYNDSKHFTRIKQHVNFYENSYLDKKFKKFLSFIEQHANLDKVPGTRNVHSCLLLFICNTRKYMVNIYKSFDNNLLKDFNAFMYKSLAFHIGAVFSNCYTYNPDNPEVIKLYDEFFDKNVQGVRV